MTDIKHRTVDVGGLQMQVAEAGEGPLVVLLHGFPESWYSWRHQLVALAAAGFHAVAPNQRGYPGTGGPSAIEDYTILHLVGDVVGLIGALGEETATVVGHDWGAPVAWHTALLRPDLVRGVAALSVPYNKRSPVPTLTALGSRFGPNFYQIYFQRPGVAEADFEADLDGAFRRSLVGLSGDSPQIRPLVVPDDGGFLDIYPLPEKLPSWLTEQDIDAYVREYATSGFAGPLNWYRNIDRNWALTAAWADAKITPPALFVAGDRDPVVSWFDPRRLEESMRALIPDLRGFQMLPGAGHWVQQERPEPVNEALVAFAKATA
jgi:pimeloyl-ACP methyl ester carboxylesterase